MTGSANAGANEETGSDAAERTSGGHDNSTSRSTNDQRRHRRLNGLFTPAALLQKIKEDDTAGHLSRGGSTALIVRISGVAVAFIIQIALARLLGADHYGDYIYALSWLNLLVLVSVLGLDTASLRFVSVYAGQSRWKYLRGFLRRSRQLVITASLTVAMIASGIVWLLRGQLRTELFLTLQWAWLLLPITAVLQICGFNLLALKRIALAYLPRDLLRPLLLGAGVWFWIAVLERQPSAAVAMQMNLAAAAAGLLVSLYALKNALPAELELAGANYRTRDWTGVAFPLLLFSGLQLLLQRTDILMIGSLLDTRNAGIYSVAARISTVAAFGLMAVNAVAAPMIAKLYADGEREELQRLVTLATRGVVAFAVPVSAFLLLFGRHLLALFGAQFVAGYAVLIILTACQLLQMGVGLVGFLMTMTGQQKTAVHVLTGSAVLNIILNVVLIPIWGIEGAAIATGSAMLIRTGLLFYYVSERLGISATVVGSSKRLEYYRSFSQPM